MTTEQLNAMKQRLSERTFTGSVTIESLCIAAMDVHQIDWEPLVRKSNLAHSVKCREQLSFLIYNYVKGSSYLMIAHLMQRNHSTIMNNVRQARKFMDIEPMYKNQVETILEKAKQWLKEQP